MPRQRNTDLRTILLLTLMAIPSTVLARGMHSHPSALMAPAAPSVPPSLTPDSRLTGFAPLPPSHAMSGEPRKGFAPPSDPEEAKVDKMIMSICKGC
ncbi:MAG: hypothetical protein ACLP1D_21245 [Xanthobacteraceae bacterium]|jgi:hypothetical protein